MQSQQIIRPSSSPYASAICPVRKKDGSLRLCINYSSLNAKTKPDAFPTCNISECLDSLAGARYFSTIDLAQGYLQVPVKEEDKEKTAFRFPSGLWEFNRMPFGLKGAPATFCWLMQLALGHLTPTQLALYMDDVCAISETFAGHLDRLENIFSSLLQHGLRIKAQKCRFAVSETIFCGHHVSAEGVRPSPTKADAILSLSTPRSVKEVKAFLGATGWYRKFIPRYADVAKPLTHLTTQGPTFTWTDDCQITFDTLKHKLASAPILQHPDLREPFILTTDASATGLGAELAQETTTGIRPIAYFSRALTKTEQN